MVGRETGTEKHVEKYTSKLWNNLIFSHSNMLFSFVGCM